MHHVDAVLLRIRPMLLRSNIGGFPNSTAVPFQSRVPNPIATVNTYDESQNMYALPLHVCVVLLLAEASDFQHLFFLTAAFPVLLVTA
jgi:hypothetical protein